MQSIMLYIINLFENFVDIIDNKYVLIIGAKYHNSNMNNAHTISRWTLLAAPQKLNGRLHSFQKRK